MAKITLKFGRFKRQYTFSVTVLICLALLVAAALVRAPLFKVKNTDSTAVVQPFRTLRPAVDSQELYAYELHKRKVAQDELPEYCAIIRKVDPAKDDYKAYCRLVVSDIVHSVGNDKIVIYIYDSNEAYELYETKFLEHYTNLDIAEQNTVDEHLVATYTGMRAWGEDYSATHQLSYYENARNGKAEHEIYKPE